MLIYSEASVDPAGADVTLHRGCLACVGSDLPLMVRGATAL